ncbi:unnamed protein product [Didymodactylos carnosus]|uniref:Uncharacterized protein n=2 Tax=Didymodactylos carnosus TaxID=1234261 RepID=A0A8S2F479_9BILA|nr:unnamed protein product [Didymodactylos carnosus]CAF4194954.1 unnamed protein product [Didymodactylos carnosus]
MKAPGRKENLIVTALSSPSDRYFEDNYIGSIACNNRRKPPRFPLSMWNCFERLENDLPRTNNPVEGWNNAMNQFVGAAHPVIYKIIQDIKKEQHSTQILIEKFESGSMKLSRRAKYEKIDQKLQHLVTQYNIMSKAEYFKHLRILFNF